MNSIYIYDVCIYTLLQWRAREQPAESNGLCHNVRVVWLVDYVRTSYSYVQVETHCNSVHAVDRDRARKHCMAIATFRSSVFLYTSKEEIQKSIVLKQSRAYVVCVCLVQL